MAEEEQREHQMLINQESTWSSYRICVKLTNNLMHHTQVVLVGSSLVEVYTHIATYMASTFRWI